MRDTARVDVDDFRDLWESGEYVLLRVPDGVDPAFMPYHPATQSVELIDDEALYPAVVKRMIKEGVPVQEDVSPS